MVKGYRLLLKPWLGQACRFEPTCSHYALVALERHGAVVGASLAAGRLLRCHPWCDGGCDDVPKEAPRLFRALGLGSQKGSDPNASSAAAPSRDAHPQEISS